jgi:hypothetical protein
VKTRIAIVLLALAYPAHAQDSGLDTWRKIHDVFSHARCANCHVGSDNRPMWSEPGRMSARRSAPSGRPPVIFPSSSLAAMGWLVQRAQHLQRPRHATPRWWGLSLPPEPQRKARRARRRSGSAKPW